MRSLAVALACLACSRDNVDERVIRVAAAADLAKAFTELGAEFEARSGADVKLTFGSSGMLAQQIREGAPFDVFAAANTSLVREVVAAGKCDGATVQRYGRGRIVVWTSDGVASPARLADLAHPRFAKIAIANPAHAPYGAAAKQALENAGLWAALAGRIVYAENVQTTMQFARDGNADAAVIALSLAVVSDGGAYLAIDPSLHAPLDQELVVCNQASRHALVQRFADFVSSVEGREVMSRYGFTLPAQE